MKKKIVIFSLIFCLTLPCAGLLSACKDEEKKEQENPYSIDGVYQNAYGDVILNLNMADISGYTLDSMPMLEVTADGGTTWARLTVENFSANGENSVIIFTALIYATPEQGFTTESGYFYSGDTSIKAGNAADEINLAIRLGETDEYKASAASASVGYTLKTPSEELIFHKENVWEATSFTGESAVDERFLNLLALKAEEKENDPEFVLTKFSCDGIDEYMQYIFIQTAFAENENPELEYKFLAFNVGHDAKYRTEPNTDTDVYIETYEDSVSTDGWSDLNKNTVITSAEYGGYKGSESEYFYDNGGNLTQTEVSTVVYVLVRQKESSTTTKSHAILVSLIISTVFETAT